MTSVPKAKDFKSANPRTVLFGTLLGLAVSAIPFAFKTVRDREANVHAMREAQIDAKDSAREGRLRTPKKET
ncbi:hypothetical protein HOP50_05g36400 [Chloropicon primus]|uniref:Uncharacterized protein n=1 Tax=Chloropicon primus TaxID=1764295 RepID=A0A5B8MP56_9CHLO|nr:hypothetical protein A3770_05p36300 [Chloropicon primus]UPR00326.1 hypothetical protein HOP50_05g36400 [Chloropicon primus]|eukprot:QDZ21112.1 hypothetical protein A3770_05p36300 [Chloropicon primus]